MNQLEIKNYPEGDNKWEIPSFTMEKIKKQMEKKLEIAFGIEHKKAGIDLAKLGNLKEVNPTEYYLAKIFGKTPEILELLNKEQEKQVSLSVASVLEKQFDFYQQAHAY